MSLESTEDEPVVTITFKYDSHREALHRVMQVDGMHAMVFDLRNHIRSTLKHRSDFLGVSVTEGGEGDAILERLREWFSSATVDYGVFLDE